ncbi:unnamed protein product [Penicillium camemberti]|uniref:Str. FM013 n=1 Tax=Penicillium camemberti (strain FM 013) TaxID=1429867 RepID=A0A0G4PLB0_PENC3|nr:unnamed protein product [Penicillium camemberti]
MEVRGSGRIKKTTTATTAIMGSILDLNNAQEQLAELRISLWIGPDRVAVRQILVLGLRLELPPRVLHSCSSSSAKLMSPNATSVRNDPSISTPMATFTLIGYPVIV